MNFRQVRKKIKSVNSVKKITKAMQLVSAVKMKKAQGAVVESRPYRETLEQIIRRISTTADPSISALMRPATGTRELIIFVSSNKGLCGGFHLNLYRYMIKNVDFQKVDFITVGKKGAMFVTKMGGKLLANFYGHTPITEVSALFTIAVSNFLGKNYNTVSIVYNKFISQLRSEQVKETLLPVTLPTHVQQQVRVKEYLIEPSPYEILDALLKSFVEEKIRGAIMSSEAVEHSSRMMAMKNATDNANDVIYNLTLLGNKLRQSKITMELLDMITAKESVETN